MGFFAMIVIVLFLLLFWLILRTKLRVNIKSKENRIRIVLEIWRIPVFRMELIVILRQGVIPYVFWERKKVCLRMFPNSDKPKKKRPEWIKRVLREAYKAEKLHIDALIGTGDAAETAYAVGLARIFAETAANTSKLRCRDRLIRILPDFSKTILRLKIDCIITASVADIIRKAIFARKAEKPCIQSKTF